MKHLGLVGIACLFALPVYAAQTKSTFTVGATVVYNCAMDTSKLTPEQRKHVEDYCRKQGQQSAPRQGGK